MVAVNTVDALTYGFRLLGYLLVVIILGGVLILVGQGFRPTAFERGNPMLMFLFVLAGIAVIYAGGLGLMYKVIGDGVARGNEAAGRPAPPAEGQPAGNPPQGGQPAGGQPREGQPHGSQSGD